MNRNASNVLVALLVGAVAGGVAALLLAPASGAETRTKIKDTLRRTKDKAFKGMEGARDFAENRTEALKEAIQGGRAAYQKAMKRDPDEATT
jgi:gas vesicle protein